jgi:hypothetical protein
VACMNLVSRLKVKVTLRGYLKYKEVSIYGMISFRKKKGFTQMFDCRGSKSGPNRLNITGVPV